MTFKKIMSMILAITMLMGMVSNGVFVTKTEAVEEEPIFEDVTAPAVGDKVYLAADVNGTLYFFATGTVTVTKPYSLPTVTDFSNAKELTLEDPKLANEGTSVGFQLSYLNGTTTTRIYCYDALTTDGNKGIMDTGTNAANYKGRHTFNWDNEKKQIVKLGNNNVLVAKFMDISGTQKLRLLGVTATEAEAEGVYPAKFVRVHQHQYGTEWKSDGTNHWHECSCGAKSDVAAHDYKLTNNGDTHIYKCACGLTKDESAHDYASEWKNDETNHWHECECGAKKDQAAHSYGNWVNDYAAGTRSQTCGDCGYVNTEELNHVCTESDTWAGDDTHHWKVCTECEKPIESTKGEHSLGNWETNADQHWHTCSGCGVKKDLADHSYGDWSYDLENKTQSRTCSGCGNVQTEEIPFFDTISTENELNAAVSGQIGHYLTAVVDGVRYYFRTTASGEGVGNAPVNTTNKYSVYTTSDVDRATLITPESYKCDTCGDAYILKFNNGSKDVWIYAQSAGVGNATGYSNCNYHFHWDAENNYLYRTIDSTKYILVIKTIYNTKYQKDMLHINRVPADDWDEDGITDSVDTEVTGVYPVQLATHTHAYAETLTAGETQHWYECPCGSKKDAADHSFSTPKSNDTHHWTECACGAKSDEAEHAYTERKSNETHHWDECACGAKSSEETHHHVIAGSDDAQHWIECECGHRADVTAHTFSTVWNKDSAKHWHECACGAKSDDDVHEYGDWVNDYQNNTKTQSCKVCQYANTVELNHACTESDKWSTDGENHWKVCGECNQIIESTKEGHSFAGAYQQNADGHWHVCSVCQATSAVESHNYENYKYNDAQHWVECACGRKTNAEDHMYGNWIIDSAPTESSAGSRHKECAACKKQVTESIPMLLKEAVYYLTANFGGKDYYFLHTAASTGTFGAHSLPVTDKASDCTNITIICTEIDGVYTYAVQYEDADGTVWYLYVNDEGKDGRVDTGRTKSLRNDRTTFLWDAENQRLYQQEVVDGAVVNYVLAIKKLSNDTTEELRMIAVPESELGEGVVAVKLELAHVHDYKDSWSKDAYGHWHECACGSKQDQAAHEITKWTTLEEPTKDEAGIKSGKCDVCGYTVVTYIPATGIEAPEDGDVVYLSAEINGVRYYFRHALSGESVGTTKPNSLYATSVVTDATGITVKVNAGIYLLTYDYKKSDGTVANYRVYVASNGTAITAKDDADLINFSWNDEAKVLYQMEGEEKYVLAFKVMKNNTTGADEVRMVAVPAAELSDSVVAVQLIDGHVHSYGSEWKSDETGHWNECDCGAKSDVQEHSVSKWTVTKEPTATETGVKTGKCDTCGYQVTAAVPATGALENAPNENTVYNLTGKFESVLYYFLHKNGGTGETGFQSLHVTDAKNTATGVTIVHEEKNGGYIFHVKYQDETGAVWYLYVNDEGADGKMDTGRTKSLRDDRTTFLWDAKNKRLYQDEGGVKYVLALKKLEKTAGGEELRLVAVPETELGESVVAITLEAGHTHSYGSEWKSDATGHWHACECGSKQDQAAHEITEWTVDKEATEFENGSKSGKCDVCGYKVTKTIPATGIVIEAPKDGDVRYLTAEINGVRYYYRHSVSGESVTTTSPYSLYVTSDISKAYPVTMVVNGDVYRITYDLNEKNYRIYINASGVGVTAKDDAALIDFSWDDENNCFYQMEGDVKYVLVFKVMVNNGTNAQEIRLAAVPEAELNDSMAIAALEEAKEHSFGEEWKSDDNTHWHECECGARTDEEKHTVSNWTVEKEATDTEPGIKAGVCDICGHKLTKQIPAGLKPGTYYLTGIFGGVQNFFRHTAEGEKVTHTAPYSLVTTNKLANATLVSIDWDEDTNTYTISYFTNRTLYIYVNDEKPEGDVDTGVTSSGNASRTPFLWDTDSKRLYQLEDGIKYVLAFKMMTNNETGAEELRLVAVPETELGDNVVLAQLQVDHIHSYGSEWKSDATSHWHTCDCGAKADENDHNVNDWSVEKEATETEAGVKTGTCAVCGYKVKVSIPATAPVEPPKAGQVSYLSVVVDGVRYYFRHTSSGESVTNTAPYSLYATTNAADAIALTVQSVGDAYRLNYNWGEKSYYIYINASGVGITAKEESALIDFHWDAENNVLYQMEGDVKHVLAFKMMSNSSSGAKELRITSVALSEIQAGSDACVAGLYSNNGTPGTGDSSMTALAFAVLALSFCALAVLVIGKKKWF